MDRIEKARKLYNNLLLNNHYTDMIFLYIMDCLDSSLNTFDMDLITDEKRKNELVGIIYDYYLDTDIQISKIADIVVEHINELDDDNFDINEYADNLY